MLVASAVSASGATRTANTVRDVRSLFDWVDEAPTHPKASEIAELRKVIAGVINSYRDLLAMPLTERIQVEYSAADTRESEAAEAAYRQAMDEALETVRTVHAILTSSKQGKVESVLRRFAPDLLTPYQSARADMLAYARETIRALVLLGAGPDDDAELAADVIPLVG